MSNNENVYDVVGLPVEIVDGDITRVKADAMITAINSGGLWAGGMDEVLRRLAKNSYHDQVSDRLKHKDVVIARKKVHHAGSFKDVVFVIDDLAGPLSEVVQAALLGSDRAGYGRISMVAIRTGVMLGQVERDASEASKEIVRGIKDVALRGLRSLNHLTVVSFRQPVILKALTSALQRV